MSLTPASSATNGRQPQPQICDRSDKQASEIDPFGAAPRHASRIAGLGGVDPPTDNSYVFRTLPLRLPHGPLRFELQFQGLRASAGTIVLQVTAMSSHPGAQPIVVDTTIVNLAELAAASGSWTVEIVSRRNSFYLVSGNIYDETDATASGVSLAFTHLARPEPSASARSAVLSSAAAPIGGKTGMQGATLLVGADPATLIDPVSQGWTDAQCREGPFKQWMAAVRRPSEPDAGNWELAYLLQTLSRYGQLRAGARGLGIGALSPQITSALAAVGCEVLATARQEDLPPGADPGAVLEGLCRPDLCDHDRFFAHVHFTPLDLGAIPPEISNFDFLWTHSVANSLPQVRDFQNFVLGVMRCLKVGGMAVHIIRQSESGGFLPEAGLTFTRSDIERMAVFLAAYGHQVAQLKFGNNTVSGPRQTAWRPFGFIAVRG